MENDLCLCLSLVVEPDRDCNKHEDVILYIIGRPKSPLAGAVRLCLAISRTACRIPVWSNQTQALSYTYSSASSSAMLCNLHSKPKAQAPEWSVEQMLEKVAAEKNQKDTAMHTTVNSMRCVKPQ